MNNKKDSFLSFLLGLVIVNKILPWFIHLIYWVIIVGLVVGKYLIK